MRLVLLSLAVCAMLLTLAPCFAQVYLDASVGHVAAANSSAVESSLYSSAASDIAYVAAGSGTCVQNTVTMRTCTTSGLAGVSGNYVVVAVGGMNYLAVVSSVAVGTANLTQITKAQQTNNSKVELWGGFASNAYTSFTVTITSTNNTQFGATLAAYSGVSSAGSTASQICSSVYTCSVARSIQDNNSLVVAGVVNNETVTTPTFGTSTVRKQTTDAHGDYISLVDQSSSTPATVTITGSTSPKYNSWSMAALELRAAATLCGGPLTYCAPTPVGPLPIPDPPPAVSTLDPFTGKGIMLKTPWSNSNAMRLTDGTTFGRTTSFGLFYAGQSDPAVRSPMLGARASENCNHASPTCYYMRVISTGAVPKVIWVDGGSNPTQGTWKTGDLCADNPHYQATNGYTLYAAYNYGATTGNTWHAPKFLQTPGSEGILLDAELRTATGARNGGLRGDDAWLVARDLTTCSNTVDVPETPVVDFSALYPAFDPTHTQNAQGFGPAFTEATATATSAGGVVSLQSGIYCVTLNRYTGDDSHGTAVVCYDASLGKGHWFDASSGTIGPDDNSWGQSGPITTTCATSTCQPIGTCITAIHMNSGTIPYLQLDMANQTFWDMHGLNFTMVINGVTQRIAVDHVMADAFNQFSLWPLLDYSRRTPLSLPPPYGWSKPSTYANKIVFPGGLYYGSNHLPFTGTGDPGVAFVSASNGNAITPCVHDVGGTCGIYGIALDGSGTQYSFFPHFASMQPGGVSDTVKANLAAYIDSAGFTWIYWGSDWMGTLGCSDGVTAANCSATGKKNRADVFAAVVQ